MASSAETLSLSCPHCGQRMRIYMSQAGDTVRCPGCNQAFEATAQRLKTAAHAEAETEQEGVKAAMAKAKAGARAEMWVLNTSKAASPGMWVFVFVLAMVLLLVTVPLCGLVGGLPGMVVGVAAWAVLVSVMVHEVANRGEEAMSVLCRKGPR